MDFTNQLIGSTPSRSSKELYKIEDFYSRRGKRMDDFRLRNLPTGDGRGLMGQITEADQTISDWPVKTASLGDIITAFRLRIKSWGLLTWDLAQVTPFETYYFFYNNSPLSDSQLNWEMWTKFLHTSCAFAWSSWQSQATATGLESLSLSCPLFLFWCSSLNELTCLVVSNSKHAFQVFEWIQSTREIIMIIISRIIPNMWIALWSHGPQDWNQSKSNKSNKDPVKGVTFLSQVVCSMIFT